MESIFKDRRPPRQDKGEPSSCLALVDGALHRSPDGCARVRPAWVARMCDAAKSDKLPAFLIYGRLRRGRAPKDVKRRAEGKRKNKADLQLRRRWGDRKGRLRQRWPASLYELAMFRGQGGGRTSWMLGAPGQKGRVSMRQRTTPTYEAGAWMAVSGVAGWQPLDGRLARPRQRIAEAGWRVSGVAVSRPFVGSRPVDCGGPREMALGGGGHIAGPAL
jgi:hypothetical protein